MKRKAQTPKLEVPLRPGARLSENFHNRRDCYKVVETDNVLGYVVLGGGRGGAPAVYPLYQATCHLKVGTTWHRVPSYEQGGRLNDYTFHLDYQGCTLALIVAQAVSALEERRRVSEKVASKSQERRRAAGKASQKGRD